MELNKIADIIKEKENIGITYHVSPDGDSIGSSLALLQCLRKIGKKAYILSRDSVPDNMSFLPYSNEINLDLFIPLDNMDCVIVLDCGNWERISADLKDFKGDIINIDHHISNDKYGKYNYIDCNAAATAEIVYDLIECLEVKCTEDMAKCMYVSLVTDTGSFRHSNTTEKTHFIAGKLIGLGLNTSKIHSNLFDNKPFEKLKLIGEVLTNMELLINNKVAVLEIKKDTVERLNLNLQDTSDVVSFGLQIKGVEVAVLLKETDEGIKGSLRSKNEVDVRKVCEVFGGGGHIKASGLKIKDKSIEKAKELILEELKKELI
ncbi:DHH family phosphoesterase [Clostridium fallax]|uniref:Phosphoesterase RecJ domain-containing protein n=1 Tax=Clostridium fallax TaxID=1533 RepID=A0A1M4V3J0_9CLOT|nr:bifunctional oligoribonuclease/PAP phosphatase NrnA [Clostridium fallax]SHE63448.1 phosphoesterase RecJ domain-containing protein [Clostridium fallax]SQB06570.1 DHH subfamily 1 protein [Clostridium fallax]